MDPITEQLAWWKDNGFMPWCAHEALYNRCPAVMTWPRLEARMRRDFDPSALDLRLAYRIESEFCRHNLPSTGPCRERKSL